MVNRTATLRRLLSLARPEWKLLGAGVLFLGFGSAMALLYPQGMRIIIDGVEVLRHLRRRQPRCACIMMTAYPSMGSAVEALRIGAQDYVEKPSPELDTIADRVQSAIRAVRLRDERDGLLVKLTALQQELKDKDRRVRDLQIQLAMAERVGPGRANEGTESLVLASRDRDARLIQAAEKLVQMARFLRTNEKLVRAIEAHVSALRLG